MTNRKLRLMSGLLVIRSHSQEKRHHQELDPHYIETTMIVAPRLKKIIHKDVGEI